MKRKIALFVVLLVAGFSAAVVKVPVAHSNNLQATLTCTGVTFQSFNFPEETHGKLYISDNALYLPGANGDDFVIPKGSGSPPDFKVQLSPGVHTLQVVVTWHNSDGNGDYNSHPQSVYCEQTTTTTPTTTVVTTTTVPVTTTVQNTTTVNATTTLPGQTTTLTQTVPVTVPVETIVPGPTVTVEGASPPAATTTVQSTTAAPSTTLTTTVTVPKTTTIVKKLPGKVIHVPGKVKTKIVVKHHTKTVVRKVVKWKTHVVVKNHTITKTVTRTKFVHVPPKVVVKWKTKVVVHTVKVHLPAQTHYVCKGPAVVKLPNGQCGFRGNG